MLANWVHIRGLGHFAKCSVEGVGVQHAKKKWTQSDLRFCKNEELKRSKNNEKGVNKIENQGEHLYKIFKNCEMQIVEHLTQLYVQLSLELNFFVAERGGQ